MLIAPGTGRVVGGHRPGLRAVAKAVPLTARVARLGPALLTTVLGALPVLVALARGHAVGGTAVIVVSLAAGAAAGWAVDDPAAELLAPLPVASSARLRLRILSVATVVAGAATVVLLAVVVGPGLPTGLHRFALEAAAAGSLALAVGLVATRRGERAAGPVAVTAGALGVVVIGGLALRWPTIFPALDGGPVHARWWLVAAAGVAIAGRAGRDVGRARWR